MHLEILCILHALRTLEEERNAYPEQGLSKAYPHTYIFAHFA